MLRNQWPLIYRADVVRTGALAQEKVWLVQAENLDAKINEARSDPEQFCAACHQPKSSDRFRTGFERDLDDLIVSRRCARDRAEEYVRWARALLVRGNETLALHFDDVEYFGLSLADVELGKTLPPRPPGSGTQPCPVSLSIRPLRVRRVGVRRRRRQLQVEE